MSIMTLKKFHDISVCRVDVSRSHFVRGVVWVRVVRLGRWLQIRDPGRRFNLGHLLEHGVLDPFHGRVDDTDSLEIFRLLRGHYDAVAPGIVHKQLAELHPIVTMHNRGLPPPVDDVGEGLPRLLRRVGRKLFGTGLPGENVHHEQEKREP